MATYTVKNTRSGATMQVDRDTKRQLGANWKVVSKTDPKTAAPATLPKVAPPDTAKTATKE